MIAANGDTLSKIKYASVETSPMRLNPINQTAKKLFAVSQHDNSDDFKNLGTLHRERRQMEIYPQDC